MATPSLERSQRSLWPDSPGNCTDGHVGPFELTSHVPRHHSCRACGNLVKLSDKLAHSVFMDPSVDPYDICGGGCASVDEYLAGGPVKHEGRGCIIAAGLCAVAGAVMLWWVFFG